MSSPNTAAEAAAAAAGGVPADDNDNRFDMKEATLEWNQFLVEGELIKLERLKAIFKTTGEFFSPILYTYGKKCAKCSGSLQRRIGNKGRF
jgi:hypothetical protein